MKILLVDKDDDTKYVGIKNVCKKRKIELDTARVIAEAHSKILFKKEIPDAIILEMNVPLHFGEKVKEHAGEMFLRELIRNEYDIPILIFSEEKPLSNYSVLIDTIERWGESEEKKFSNFLSYVQNHQKE